MFGDSAHREQLERSRKDGERLRVRVALGALLEHDDVDASQTQLGRKPATDRAGTRDHDLVLEHASILRRNCTRHERP
jgi:hypothetical protein